MIAHELGHVTGGHIVRMNEGIQQATGIMIATMLLGALAMARGRRRGRHGHDRGRPAGGDGPLPRLQPGPGEQRRSGRRAPISPAPGISGRGSLAFFRRLQNLEFRLNIPQDNGYARTHPLTGERIARLETTYQADPAWDRPTDPALEERFQRVRAKLMGYVDDPRRVLQRFPESNRSIPARYARAYAYHKSAHPEQSLAEVDALLADPPARSLFPRAEGPGAARIRAPARRSGGASRVGRDSARTSR